MAKSIIGVDEVGYGPIAGPVVTAAVVLRANQEIVRVRDSKKVTLEDERYALSEEIKEKAIYWVIAGADAGKIDRFGVSVCRFQCMKWCVLAARTQVPKAKVIVDGNQMIPGIKEQEAIVKADQKVMAVSAASIIAKVFRDTLMVKLWTKYPHYDWKKNMGYGTVPHMRLLRKYGPTPHHRRSFKNVGKAIREWEDETGLVDPGREEGELVL